MKILVVSLCLSPLLFLTSCNPGLDCAPLENATLQVEDNVWLAFGQSNMANKGAFRVAECDSSEISVYDESDGINDQYSLLMKSFDSLDTFPEVPGYFSIHFQRLTKEPISIIAGAIGSTTLTCWHVGNPCFENNVRPLIGLPVKGIIWWQGEAEGFTNGITADGYGDYFVSMIQEWRNEFGGEIPFIFVELQTFNPCIYAPAHIEFEDCNENASWTAVREGQLKALALPLTAMARSTDITNGQVHPAYAYKNIAKRLAILASEFVH